MAKIIKMTPDPKADKDFQDFYNKLPKEEQKMLDQFKIKNFDELAMFATMLGIDVNKFMEPDNAHDIDLDDPKQWSQFMLGDKNPFPAELAGQLAEMYDEDYEDEDFFTLPERVFIGDDAEEYHLRIKLNNAPVPIWREVKVPSNITLEVFSHIILEAIGWTNSHLHMFRKGDTLFKNTDSIRQDMELGFYGMGPRRTEDTNDWSLRQVLKEKGDRIKYEYDFGDGWEHEIWVKGIREYAPGEKQEPTVIKGKGLCPPEDCGGVYGYADLLRIHAKKRKTADEKERLRWYFMLDDFFNPEVCDLEAAQVFVEELWEELTETLQ